ncbi:MAG: C1 family peptidase [bacterium]|nr:C1 family peptidase [bacterium]
MKNFMYLFIGLFIYSPIAFGEDLFLKQLQEELHKRGDPWIAGETSVSKLPPEQQKKLFSTVIPETQVKQKARTLKHNKSLPTTWDWRSVNGQNWMTAAKDQGDCGGCWAFACVGSFESRINIANSTPNYSYDLSEQFMISCDTANSGCMGGTLPKGVNFLMYAGVPDEACFTYKEIDAACSGRCSNWASRVVKAYDWDQSSTASEFKDAAYEGPVAAAYMLKKDFLYYKGGVYTPIMGEVLGGHAMIICGWDDSQNAWLLKNSWGTAWGVQGFDWINSPQPLSIAWPIVNPTTKPSILLVKKQISDGNDNIWNKGETANLINTLTNLGINATNVNATLSISDPYVSVTTGSAAFGNIAKNATGNNSGSPFVISANGSTPDPYTATFNLHVTADGSYAKDISVNLNVGLPTNFEVPSNLSCLMGLAFDSTYLWGVNLSSTYIYKFSQQGYLLDSIPTPNNANDCRGIAYGNGYLWVHHGGTKKIYKVNPTNGSIASSFSSPCTGYPSGLCFDGTNLWAVDGDAYKIYKLTTAGVNVSNFNIPSGIAQPYMPYDLGFEPLGPNGGSLLLFVTHWHQSGSDYYFDSTAVWEMTRAGVLVATHRFRSPDTDGCCIEVNPMRSEYWVNSLYPNKIYRVAGFYKQGAEENNTFHYVNFDISPNPSSSQVHFNFNLYKDEKVNISVYDLSGRTVYKMNQVFKAGNHTTTWNCKKIPYGIYFSVMEVGDVKKTKKFVFMK